MGTYFELDAEHFKSFFVSKGFTETVPFREIVFVRKHDRNPALIIKVYSSLDGGGARSVGNDAIRVAGIYDDGNKSFGLFKGKRVFRTTSQEAIEERTLHQMRLCYARLNEWINKQR